MNTGDLDGDHADLSPAPPADPAAPAGSWQPPRTRATGLSTGQIVFGAILIAVGAVWLLSVLDIADIDWRGVLAAALIVVGLALVAVARSGHHGGLITLGIVLSLFLGTASTLEGVFDVPFEGGIGDRSYQVGSAADLQDAYRLSIGQLLVDLRAMDVPPGTTEVEVSVVIGELIVETPPGAAVEVIGKAGAGSVRTGSSQFDGVGVEETITDPGFAGAEARLRIRASVGLGQVEVRR